MAPHVAGDRALSLLELPRELAARGYDTVQLCHFHLPRRDRSYLEELRSALDEAGVVLDALLVDAGDLVHPTSADDHEEWIAGWLQDAGVLGAVRGRVIAGQATPTTERLNASGRRLRRLAQGSPVRVVTENWMALLPSAVEVHQLLDAASGEIGLLVDLGNWKGPDRDSQLASIGGVAETCHAKCATSADGVLEVDDYRRALQAVLGAGYGGPLCLVHDGPGSDEWDKLAGCQAVVDEVVSAASAA
jgi:sugar phosphate isomerase/epimerase